MRLWHWIMLALLTLSSFVVEIFFIGHQENFWWNKIPGFFALLGFIGCYLLGTVAKALGRQMLEKDEDYYNEP